MMKQIVALLLLFGACLQTSCKRNHASTRFLGYDFRNGGEAGTDLLVGDKYTSIEIEVQYMPGYKLKEETVKNATDFLEQVCDKPDGISIRQSEIDLSRDTMTLDRVKNIEEKYRGYYTNENTISIFILVTDGFSDDRNIAAYTYRNTSAVIFGKTISENLDAEGRVRMETFLMIHELGHILGLVNRGTPMAAPHEGKIVAHHCNSTSCVMNYGTVNTSLDSACLNDLEAAKKKYRLLQHK